MKHAKWLVVVTLVVLSGMAVAQLIGSSRIVAQVPFAFVVANKTVPAGEYEVQALSVDRKTLIIRNAYAKVGLLTLTSQAESNEKAPHYAMVFKRYGDRYFLAGIKLQGSKVIYNLPESGAETELRSQNVSGTEETLLAALE
jgi:hypothetical protein